MAKAEGTMLKLLLSKNYEPFTDKLFSAAWILLVVMVHCDLKLLGLDVKFKKSWNDVKLRLL